MKQQFTALRRLLFLALALGTGYNSWGQTYCTPTYTFGGGGDNVTSVVLGTLNNNTAAAGNPSPYYTDYGPQQTGTSPTLSIPLLVPGTTSNITLTFGTDGSQYSAVWVDFNKNGTFDATEYFSLGTNAGASGTAVIPIVVPIGATTGQTKMRVRGGDDNAAPSSTQACGATGSPYGEAEDYFVNIAATVACTGTPPTITATGPASACPGTSFTLTASGPALGTTGLTYQWQSSPTPTGTFTNLGTASASATYTVASQTAATSYRVIVTCTASAQSATSNVVTVTVSPFLNCYCTPTYAIGGAGDGIVRVVLGSLNNPSSATNTTPYYTNYAPQQTGTSPTVAIPILVPGTTSNVSVTVGSDGNQYVGVWVDFNQNGVFETTEYFSLGTNAGANGTSVIPIVVPIGATTGQTKMRVRGGEDNVLTSAQACGASSSPYGEAEDYLVNVAPVVPCTGTPPTITATGPASTCPGASFTLTASGPTPGTSGLTYQWQSSPTPTGTFTNLGTASASATYTVASQTTATSYRVIVTCTASAQSATSNVVTVTVSPFLNCYCTPTYASGGTGDGIVRVVLNTLNNPSPATNTTPYYTDYAPQQTGTSPTVAIPGLSPGIPSNVSVTVGADGSQYVSVWVDFNQNGVFETTEFFSLGTNAGANGTSVIPIMVPATAVLGRTKMRVRGGDDVAQSDSQACGATNSPFGEAEDYLVNIVPCTGGSAAAAAFSYGPTASYCQSGTTAPAVVLATGATAGTFTSTTGLTLNATTGGVTLASSTPGTYTVTNTIVAGGTQCASVNTTTITITAPPSGVFSYPATPLTCANTAGTITPVLAAGATAGTFSLPTATGLSINSTTGVVTVGTTAATGTYTVTNTIAPVNGCAQVTTTATFFLSLPPTSTFAYAGSSYCQNGLDPTPLITGTTGGVFSAPAGLAISASTGTIALYNSTPGTYTVTYVITTPCGTSTTTRTVSISAQPTAGFTYLPNSGCTGSTATIAPILLGGGVIGTFSVIPAAGLTVNATTGVINLSGAVAGTYTIANTVAATANCGVSVNSTTFTVSTAPAAPVLTSSANPTGGILLTSSVATGNQFYRNGVLIPGATNQTFIVNSNSLNGTYTVVITNAAGCSATSNAVPVTITATTPASAGTSLTVYPNPTRDGLLTLELSGYRESVQLSVMNALGQRVYEGTVTGNGLNQKQALNLGALPAGIYLLQARTASGSVETRRLVRE